MKTVLLGDTGVGKSSLFRYLSQKEEPLSNTPTIGGAFMAIRHLGGPPIHLWDTAGQERFQSLTPMYLRGAKIVILMFDNTKQETYDNIEKIWMPIANYECSGSDTKFIYVGNKMDLCDDDNNINIYKTSADDDGHSYFEISCVTGDGIEELTKALTTAAKMAEFESERNSIGSDVTFELNYFKETGVVKETCQC